jgi:hypothetical protein
LSIKKKSTRRISRPKINILVPNKTMCNKERKEKETKGATYLDGRKEKQDGLKKSESPYEEV